MPRQKIAESDIDNFATLLYRWSCSESSYFLRQFWRTFGMSEMQFYKRVWKAQDQVKDFDFPEIKKNLRRNRFARNLLKKEKYHGKKTIRVNFKRSESVEGKSGQDAEEARRL